MRKNDRPRVDVHGPTQNEVPEDRLGTGKGKIPPDFAHDRHYGAGEVSRTMVFTALFSETACLA